MKRNKNFDGWPQERIAEWFETEITDLVISALAEGVVISVETKPRQKLAMGEYDLVVSSRPRRNYNRLDN